MNDFARMQYAGAVRQSRWFVRSEVEVGAIPEALTTGMPAVATALWGRWWLVLLLSALIAQGAFAGVVGKREVDEPRRAYVYMLGLGIVVPSLMNVAGCIGWMPVLNLGIPFASYGGSLVMATLVGMGILCSALMNETVGNMDGNAS